MSTQQSDSASRSEQGGDQAARPAGDQAQPYVVERGGGSSVVWPAGQSDPQ